MRNYTLNLDIGGTNTRIATGYADGRIEGVKIIDSRGINERTLFDSLKTYIKEKSLPEEELSGVGIGVAGIVDPRRKRIVKSSNVPCMDFSFLENELKTEIKLENDANAATMGEKHYGHGKDADNFIYLTFSTGIGSGVFYDGRLLGSSGDRRAGEAGSIVIDPSETPEKTGRKGFWSAYSSGRGIPNYTRRLLAEDPRETKLKHLTILEAKDIFDAARSGDEVALDYRSRIATINAAGLGTMINLYGPEVISIGGSVMLNNPELLEMTKSLVPNYIANPMPKINIAKLGAEAGLYGASKMAFSR